MTDKYAVIGNPIAHSKSPEIHTMFAEQFKGMPAGDMVYQDRILVPLDGFAAAIVKGYQGCNVTVPFKLEAWRLAASTSTVRAFDAKAVNTLTFKNGEVFGDNTDGVGLVRDIEQNLGIALKDKRILLIGAGGAAQGVLHPLLEASQIPLVISNRSPEKAVSLKKSIEQHEKFRLFSVKAVEFGDLAGEQFDVVINATSAGLKDEMPLLPPGIFAPGAVAYDMMYGRETPFMKFALSQGVSKDRVVDGLGMLVEQAAESFFFWRGAYPQTAPVIAALRNAQ